MDTQNTPIHLRLWHRGFWFLTLAGMMLSMAATMLLPVVYSWSVECGLWIVECGAWSVALAFGAFAVGTWLFGGMCSFLTQRFRRNHVFQLSVFVVQLCLLAFYLVYTYLPEQMSAFMPLLSLCLGAFWGIAQIVLCSTLIIDVCESFQRTEANHAAAWFRRFSLSLGPVVGLLLYQFFGINTVLAASAIAACLSIVFVGLVDFPFKAPDDNLHLFSCDRFLLCNAHLMIVTLLLITLVFGMMLSIVTTPMFFGTLMLGFLLAIIAEKIAFANADIESETIVGLICVGTALLLMLTREETLVEHIVPTLTGFGFGIIGSRFMLFFIKLSNHCQRGTSQSTFFLTWTTGLCLGLALGHLLTVAVTEDCLLLMALALTILSLVLYHFIVHPWYMRSKNR